MNALTRAFWLSSALALAACGPGAATGDAGGNGDASQPADTGGAPLPACVPPIEEACVQEGCRFAPITLRSCDPGEPEIPFYGSNYCDMNSAGQPAVRATVVVIAAGWCGPCQAEAPEIERIIRQGYADRGVRVISVVVQKPDYSASDAAFCNEWRTRYSLNSIMAFDPRMVTSRYFPDMALPSNMIIDRRGTIRWRQYGTSSGLSSMRTALDEVLAGETGM